MRVLGYWLDRARDGDEIAMERILAAVEPFVRDFVRTHIEDRHDVEDVVQECLVGIWKSLDEKRDKIRDFEGWCSRIIWRRIDDYYRRIGRSREMTFSEFFGDGASEERIEEIVSQRGVW